MEEKIFENRVDLTALNTSIVKIREEIGKIIVGQERMIDLLITAILADGHVLIEGVPGVAKTLTAKLLSRPIIEAPVPRMLVRRSMPQPSQFAMGLPVSRFAAMATPLPQTKAHQRGKTRRPSSRVPLDTVMKEFVSTPTPTIMVEDKAVSRSRPSARLKAAEAGPAGRVRIAVAR